MNTVRVSDKPLNLVYTHMKGDNKTALDGTLVIDSTNKLSANYAFDSGNCRIKYSYNHGDKTTIEPCYDLGKNSWDFAVTQKVYDCDVIKATYQTSNSVLGLDWFSNSKYTGGFKVIFFLYFCLFCAKYFSIS